MAKEGINAVVDDISAVLNTANGWLAARLDEQDTDYDDGITLPDAVDRDIRFGDSIELPPPQNFPAIYILPRGWSQGELLYGAKDQNHLIDVQVYLAHTVHATLTKMLYRYGRAVELTLEDKLLANSSTLFDMSWSGAVYSPVIPWRETGMLIKGIELNGVFNERVTRPFT